MSLPDFSMRELLEAGVHFGHKKNAGIRRWKPLSMAKEMVSI